MDRHLQFQLQQLGLEENEAAVYLAALELGPSPVQKIAQRAEVPRATSYLVLGTLRKKGLVTTFDRGKKVYFAATHPSQLEATLQRRESELKVQRDALENLVPELERRGQFPESLRPRVQYYEGHDAVAAYRRDILRYRKDQKVVRAILSLEGLQKMVGDLKAFAQKRVQERVRSRAIYIDPKGIYPNMDNPKELREARKISEKEYPVPADVSIIGNSVGFMPYSEPYRAIIIEDPVVAESLTSLFELAWQGAGSSKKRNKSKKKK